MDIIKLKKDLVEKWKGEFEPDEKLKNATNRLGEWIGQIPVDVQAVVITLLYGLKYYSRQTINKALYELHEKLINNYVTNDDTIYVFLKSEDGQSNSSNDYWTEYKRINKLYNNLCYENAESISPEAWNLIKNIVYIDDCCGSGDSFLKELKKAPDKFQGKNVFFIAIHFMKKAAEKISRYCNDNNINFFCIYSTIEDKAFIANFKGTNEKKAKDDIVQMSEGFLIPENEILGYKKSQSLMVFYNNTPNNTLGFIRYDTSKYISLFPRRKEPEPFWLIKDKEIKRQQKIDNYNAQKRNAL